MNVTKRVSQTRFAIWDCRGKHGGWNLHSFLVNLPPEILPDASLERDQYNAGQYMVDRQRIWLNLQAVQLAIKFLKDDGAYWKDEDRKWYDETIVAGFEAALKWLETSQYHMVQLRTRYYG
jgi:hypothetical protein